MMLKPFSQKELSKILIIQNEKISNRIQNYTNDEIMANNLDILAENCFEEFKFELIDINEEDVSKRTISQGKIKRFVEPFFKSVYNKEFVFVDGVIASFYFPFSGDKNLFSYQASTYSLSGYPEIYINSVYIAFIYEIPLSDFKSQEDKDKCLLRLNRDLKTIKDGASYVNQDCKKFNDSLKDMVLKLLQKQKEGVEKFYNISKMFEVPLKKTDYGTTHIPMQRKISPIAKKYNNETNYYITEAEYIEILEIIKHNCATYERTPSSCKNLHEEDLRNFLLGALNGYYLGRANGEAFRNNGKTDICIECENRAAFVAECKMWTGAKSMLDAINQLVSYLTWRDSKTALVFFSKKNKDFFKVLETVKNKVKEHPNFKSCLEKNKNELECCFSSSSNIGQLIKVRLLVFNLYSE